MRFNLFNRLETLDYLIRSRSTGTPAKLAKRLDMSERSLYEFLETMRDLGAPVCYCKLNQTYYYSENGSFSISFRKDERPPDDSKFTAGVFSKLVPEN